MINHGHLSDADSVVLPVLLIAANTAAGGAFGKMLAAKLLPLFWLEHNELEYNIRGTKIVASCCR